MSLLNPGTLTEYSGPSRSSNRRSRGTVRVRDPAHGFFLAGSSIDRLNGIYGRVRNEHVQFLSGFQRTRGGLGAVRLAYRHDSTGWLMCLVEVDPESLSENEDDDDVRYGFKEPCGMQWRLIDDKGINRFRHKGDTIIPGAGIRWKHFPLPKPPSTTAAPTNAGMRGDDYVSSSESESESESYDGSVDNGKQTARDDNGNMKDVPLDDDNGKDDTGDQSNPKTPDNGAIVRVDEKEQEFDEDELPWQVIALLDRSVLEDLRFSSACRDEKVARALKGLDVEQPPESSTIEGFLEAERKALRSIESGMLSSSDNEDGNDDDDNDGVFPEPKGWLYRVVAEAGVQLYTAPSDTCDDGDDSASDSVEGDGSIVDVSLVGGDQRIVGMRSKGSYVRVVEVKGRWLRLARTEPSLREVPLAVGDSIRVTSGHYLGQTGEITKDLNDETREFGVRLAGYTGTGFLHISALVRDGPHPLSHSAMSAARRQKSQEAVLLREEKRRKREARERDRAIMKQYYGDMYEEFMPYAEDSDSDHDTDEEDEDFAGKMFGHSIENNDESQCNDCEYDDSYTGALWVPLREASASDDEESALLEEVPDEAVGNLRIGTEKDGAELFDRPFEPRIEGESLQLNDEVDSEDDSMETDHKSNEIGQMLCPGAHILSTTNAEGQEKICVGETVRLCDLRSHSRYNGRTGCVIAPKNADGRIGVRLNPDENPSLDECDKKLLLLEKNLILLSSQAKEINISGNLLTEEEKQHAIRAARILNVHPEAIGLAGAERIELSQAKKILRLRLHVTERECQPHCPRDLNASAQKLQLQYLQESKKAHAALLIGLEKVHAKSNKNVSSKSILSMSPSSIINSGLLGERAKVALALASDAKTLERSEVGLSELKNILKDEQARIIRQKAGGELIPVQVPDWKLEKAELEACRDESEADNECLLMRLAIVLALFETGRIAEAMSEAKLINELFPNNNACTYIMGRILIRQGHRTEGINKLNSCVTSCGPEDGSICGKWAHTESVHHLRSHKRILRCEFQARDSYERADFREAVKKYSEMIRELEVGYASDDKWGRAEALIARAACHRRNRNLKAALSDCESGLELFPRFPRALFRRALCLLEDQRPQEALVAFEQLLRVKRDWPNLLDWLIRATAASKRQGSGNGSDAKGTESFDGDIGEMADKDFYGVLGVSTDATEAQLKRAYRLMSLKVHPDKKGGSAAAFHLVAEAYETLSDEKARQLYDDGVDINKKQKKKDRSPYDDSSSESEDEDGNKKKSLREEVERKYYPENFKFWPFGDPFVNKRRHQARKRKQAEQEKARQERMKKRGNPQSSSWWQGHDDWDI